MSTSEINGEINLGNVNCARKHCRGYGGLPHGTALVVVNRVLSAEMMTMWRFLVVLGKINIDSLKNITVDAVGN